MIGPSKNGTRKENIVTPNHTSATPATTVPVTLAGGGDLRDVVDEADGEDRRAAASSDAERLGVVVEHDVEAARAATP